MIGETGFEPAIAPPPTHLARPSAELMPNSPLLLRVGIVTPTPLGNDRVIRRRPSLRPGPARNRVPNLHGLHAAEPFARGRLRRPRNPEVVPDRGTGTQIASRGRCLSAEVFLG